MVQVLPYVPSFGEKLASAIGRGTEKAGDLYHQHQEKTRVDRLVKEVSDPAKTDIQRISAFQRLPESYQKYAHGAFEQNLKNNADQSQFNALQPHYNTAQDAQRQTTNQPQDLQGTNNQQMAQPQGMQQFPNAVAPSPINSSSNPQSMSPNPQDTSTASNPIRNYAPLNPIEKNQLLKEAALPGLRGNYAKQRLEEDREQEKLQIIERKAAQSLEKARLKAKTDKERQIFTSNEPKLIKMSDQLHQLQGQSDDLQRLSKLFENDSDFPSSTLASFFTKDGDLDPILVAQLSPNAQNALKIIAQAASGAKDMVGGRATNFDVKKFLEGYPSLLNSPEARKQIIYDLQEQNKFNSDYINGILDEIDSHGGSDQISFSKAERIYQKTHADEIEKQRQKYIKGYEQTTFESVPEASKYSGRTARLENGTYVKSDGKRWVPYDPAEEEFANQKQQFMNRFLPQE